jgi:hypothetical protein
MNGGRDMAYRRCRFCYRGAVSDLHRAGGRAIDALNATSAPRDTESFARESRSAEATRTSTVVKAVKGIWGRGARRCVNNR